VTDALTGREGEGAWTKLRRRKVVQWGITYAAGSWVLLQVIGFLADAFHWPDVAKQVGAIALLVGLPIVLTLAWYHGDKGEQRVTRAELAVLTLLLLLGGGMLWMYQHRGEPVHQDGTATGSARDSTSIASAADARPSVAVLPFDNRSDEQKDAFFVDGIHDDILTQLSKVSALKVISRTSVERFRDTKLPLRDIAQQLGVTKILEGGVQRAGDRVRINVQLIDAATDAHVWAETYDRELTAANIFAIQSEVAAAIAGALKATLTPTEKERVNAIPTQNLKAWEAYQLGRQRLAKRTSESLTEAEAQFRKAAELDTKFAPAYAGLAETLVLQTRYSGVPWATGIPRAEAAAGKALELDPNLAEAWTAAGLVATYMGENDRAVTMHRKAVELNPNYSMAYFRLSELLPNLGRAEEALVLAEKAAALDPLSGIINLNLATALDALGRFADAEARYRKVIEMDPSMPKPYEYIGLLRAYALGRPANAVPYIEKAIELDPGNPEYHYVLALLYLDLGDDAQAARLLGEARAKWPGDLGVTGASAVEAVCRGDEAAAVKYARNAFDVYEGFPVALVILRKSDLARGDYRAAREWYVRGHPELLSSGPPKVDGTNYRAAIDLVPVLRGTGENDRATLLLDLSEQFIRRIPRLGLGGYGIELGGYGITDVSIHALRGDRAKALAALRDAERAGWRGPVWRYYRDFDPNLASIRNEPEFKAVFADIERDMARQRAELAARPKDAALDLAGVTK
jgi:TolB-like protein/Flp pilus assembly protein TadD